MNYLETRHLKENDFYDLINNKKNWQKINQCDLNPDLWSFETKEIKTIFRKIKDNTITLKDYCGSPLYGIKTGYNKAFIIDETLRNNLIKKDPKNRDIIKPFLMGKDLERWFTPESQRYIIYTPHGSNINKYPYVKEHLLKYKEKLEKRATKQNWWELQQPQFNYVPFMEKEKIVYVDIANKPTFSLETTKKYLANSVYFLPTNDEYLLCLLNSNLCKWFIFFTSRAYRGGFVTFRNVYVERIPIKNINDKKKTIFRELSSEIIKLSSEFETIKNKFIRRVISDLNIKKITNKLDSFYELNSKEFFKEIKKQLKIKLSLKDKEEWDEYFVDKKEKLEKLKYKIGKIEEEIDKEIYKLYGLSNEEIKIIEENLLKL